MRFFHEKGAMLNARPKNNTKILLLSRRGKQTQEKMPPLTEKHENNLKTILSQTPRFKLPKPQLSYFSPFTPVPHHPLLPVKRCQ